MAIFFWGVQVAQAKRSDVATDAGPSGEFSPGGDPTGWGQHLDALKSLEGLRSDAALASSLGVSRGFVCAVRRGRRNISAELGQKIFDRLGRRVPEDAELFKPLRVPRKFSTHRLNPRVILLVRERAGGHCELCADPAPFRTPQGQPYLEFHHIVPLDQGGENTVSNLVALCPNCNRKLEICGSEEDTAKLKKVASGKR